MDQELTPAPTSPTRWRMSLAETLAFGVTIVTITLYAHDRFLSKSDADEWKKGIEGRVEVLEGRIEKLTESNSKIAVDVSYIRGRLEPKQ